MIREDIDEDEFIDVLIGNRKYVPCIYVRPPLPSLSPVKPSEQADDVFLLDGQVYNKIDSIPLEEVDRMSRTPLSLTISCELSLKCVTAQSPSPSPSLPLSNQC